MTLTTDTHLIQVTFGELRHIQIDEIAHCVSKETALKICQRSSELSEVEATEVLHLWAQKLFKAYDLKDFSLEYWTELVNYWKKIFQEIILNACSASKRFSLWFCDALELLSCVQSLEPQLHSSKLVLLLAFSLGNVVDFLNVYSKRDNQVELKQELSDAVALCTLAVKVLQQNSDKFSASTDAEFSSLTQVISLLCDVGEQTSRVEIKAIVETWKCVIKMIMLCVRSKLDITTSNGRITRKLAKRALKFLIQEIERSIVTVYKEDILKQPTENLEKYLRLTNFYVKLLQKIAGDFKHDRFPVASAFCEIFILSKRPPKHISNTKIVDIFNTYVCHGLDDVFKIIYKNSDISNLILRCSSDHPKLEFGIIHEYLDAIIFEKDIDFINNNVKNLTAIFEKLFDVSTTFINSRSFNAVVEFYAALTILSSHNTLEHFFRENVLRADFVKAHASAEILLIVSRCSDFQQTPKKLLLNFRFWRQCNQFLSVFSDNIKQFHLKRLLRNFLKLCDESNEISKKELWDQYGETHLMRSNYGFFLTVGLATRCSTENDVKSLLVKITDELFELLNKLGNGCSINNYYKTILYIELLATTYFTPKRELIVKLMEIVTTMLANKFLNLQYFTLMLDAIFRMMQTHAIGYLDYLLDILFLCLKENPHTQKFENLSSTQFVQFLIACSEHSSKSISRSSSDILELMNSASQQSEIYRAAIAQCSIPKYKDCKINLDVFNHLILSHNYEHTCTVADDSTPSTKRLRLDANIEKNLKQILNDVLVKSMDIVNLSHLLDKDDYCTLDTIVNRLRGIHEIKP